MEMQTKKGSVEASSPHVSLIGHITPQELLRKSGQARLAGGLASRLLFGYVTRAAG